MRCSVRSALAGICYTVLIVAVSGCWAQDAGTRARAILSDSSKSAAAAREALLSLGDAAVDPILAALVTEKDAAQPRQAFLVGILASIQSAESNRALGRVLEDTRPLVRANAAIALGKNHQACAVPGLVRLLDDRAEYGKEVSTDPYQEKVLTVGTAASKALDTIIGARTLASGEKLRATAGKWWGKNRSSLDCKGWN
jgi:hypothetical protein